MSVSWVRRQSGQAVVLVAIAILLLTAILALALDGGSIYLDRRQDQNAADAAALAGAERLMAVPVSYTNMHNQAMDKILRNLPGTTAVGTVCETACPNTATIGAPPGQAGQIALGAGYWVKFSVMNSYNYQVSVWHTHTVALEFLHGFASTITLSVQATAQNANLPYAIVLLQDQPQYQYWPNFNINGTPGAVALQGLSGPNTADRGGIFSNESIRTGSGSITFTPCPGATAGDLWAVNENASDLPVNVTCAQSPGPQPLQGTHLDFPNYPMPAPPAVSYNGKTVLNGTAILCPGQYTNAIVIQNGATGVMLPGVYEVQANGVSVQGTLRTLQHPVDDGLIGQATGCSLPDAQTVTASMFNDPGVIIEVRPDNISGSTICNKHIFAAAANSTMTLAPSPKYFNINIYIEIMPGWQTTCSGAPLGTNVVRFAGGSCYSIGGIIYGPADNMVMTGSGCGTGVGQIVAWTLTVNGNGTLNETYNPTLLPYMKGLVQ